MPRLSRLLPAAPDPDTMSQLPARLLVCRTDAIGDSLLALPVCTNLKKHLPDCHITLMVSRYTAPLYHQQTQFDQLLVYDPVADHRGSAGLKKLISLLHCQQVDTALMLYPDRRLSWAVWRAGIARRLGTGRRWWSWLYNQPIRHSRKQAAKHEAAYNLDFVAALNLPPVLEPPRLQVPAKTSQKIVTLLQNYGIGEKDSLVMIHPGGRGSSANWCLDGYAQMTAMLMARHPCRVLLTGTGSEQEDLQFIQDVCRQNNNQRIPIMLHEPLDLALLPALIHRAQVFVSGNTGPMHIAAAVGTPQIAIFPDSGPTGLKRWQPLTTKAVIFTPKKMNESTDTSGMTTDQIDPEQVVSNIINLLPKKA